jgi:hypothetical protein
MSTAKCRQAVIVIHGIGEQRPMETLREFVGGLLGSRAPLHHNAVRGPAFFSKPDRLSDTLELRRLASWPPHTPIETDFYELYWAHLMQGTAWSHVFAWLRLLMFRSPGGARPAIQVLWMVSWCLIATAVFAYVRFGPPSSATALWGYGLGGLLAFALLRLMGGFGLSYIGDAARYLSPFPFNVAVRKNIRDAVVDLLTKVHEEQPSRYDRIVVVGHSLGSVIAYDALTHLWQRRHSTISNPHPEKQISLARVRRLSRRLERKDLSATSRARLLDRYRIRQRDLFCEERAVGIDWRISDLVTLGSPLSHAPFLLARDPATWKALKLERMFPTSPPQTEDGRDQGRLLKRFDFPGGTERADIAILHHAAVFACTRWTNLFFASDLIGGPVAGEALFGYGIKDIKVPAGSWTTRWTPRSHVRYWAHAETDALRELWEALDLAWYPQRSQS